MYLNFDKIIPALIIFSVSDLYILEKQEHTNAIRYTSLSLLLCIAIIMVLSLISGYALFEAKIPSILPILAINNFFFVCMAEEVFFLGCFTKNITKSFTETADFSCYYSIFNIWIVHFQGGLIYIALSTICWFFYGYAYYKTGKILCSMIVHFGLNLCHLLLFTYPALLKLCEINIMLIDKVIEFFY
ncbi:CPBP family intramembrane glutamic endopeptidase [Candidatus Rickettsia kedanie]|uniref:CPBP family intramembrane glutamic endopeptidase n=1 Tax=Candidatus Rickettsia kedanie TaxID=3115352 RepID=UPI00399C9ECD